MRRKGKCLNMHDLVKGKLKAKYAQLVKVFTEYVGFQNTKNLFKADIKVTRVLPMGNNIVFIVDCYEVFACLVLLTKGFSSVVYVGKNLWLNDRLQISLLILSKFKRIN